MDHIIFLATTALTIGLWVKFTHMVYTFGKFSIHEADNVIKELSKTHKEMLDHPDFTHLDIKFKSGLTDKIKEYSETDNIKNTTTLSEEGFLYSFEYYRIWKISEKMQNQYRANLELAFEISNLIFHLHNYYKEHTPCPFSKDIISEMVEWYESEKTQKRDIFSPSDELMLENEEMLIMETLGFNLKNIYKHHPKSIKEFIEFCKRYRIDNSPLSENQLPDGKIDNIDPLYMTELLEEYVEYIYFPERHK